ncbi:MAG TPA: GGDEF domain-containing protein [Acidimicrobiales bacterium]|nr:GGDEF domain-containing protein [Acidimicrobiales bacterium]
MGPDEDRGAADDGLLSTVTSARLAAGLYIASGVVTAASPLLPAPPTSNRNGILAVGVLAVAVGAAVWLSPCGRLSRRWQMLLLMPPAMALISVHNYYAGADTYRYDLFYMVAFMWVGLTQRRWSTLPLCPVAAASYLAPLMATPHSPWAIPSAIYAIPIFVLVGETISWVSTQLAATRADLARLAYTDTLTGLANRAGFYRHLDRAWSRAQRHGHDLAVLFIDLDGFKALNDAFGHRVGDEVLATVGSLIRTAVRTGDEVARLGGDEFAVVAEHVEGPLGASLLAARVLSAITDASCAAGPLSASVGVAVGPMGVMGADELVRHSDVTMYQAKRAGGRRLAMATA